MKYNEITYEIEAKYLSRFASKSAETKGRQRPMSECPMRTEFQRDRDRILHTKAFRRLKRKTQVFLSPEGDHYRTRMTHTLEVSQIARSISRALRLNEDLTEAIALGHDLGHTPYGHAGETALRTFIPFNHNEQSLRVVDTLEYEGRGLNLTSEVRDGILNHTSKGTPSTLEGVVVQWSDRIAYINHDIDDSIRAGILKESDLSDFHTDFGSSHGKRINCMILDIIQNSFDKPVVAPSPYFEKKINQLRDFLFQTVYRSDVAKKDEYKAEDMIRFLFRYYLDKFEEIPAYIRALAGSKEQKICDHIAMMSDHFAVKIFKSITIPENWDS